MTSSADPGSAGCPCRTVDTDRAILGEGPIVDPRDGRVWWVDIKGRTLRSYDPANAATRRYDLPCRIGSIAVPTAAWGSVARLAEGSFLCAGDIGFGQLTCHDDRIEVHGLVHPEPDASGNRFNDGKLGPDQRYYAGTMDDAEQEARGSLYAFSPSGTFEQVDGGYMVTNGPAFSPDGTVMYHNDSAARVIYRFSRARDGRYTQRAVFHRFDVTDGYPDGMTTDADGTLYVAMWDGACIAVLDRAGGLRGRLAVPTARPTSCAFSLDGRRLFVTSASIGAKGADHQAGHLFELTVDRHLAVRVA